MEGGWGAVEGKGGGNAEHQGNGGEAGGYWREGVGGGGGVMLNTSNGDRRL